MIRERLFYSCCPSLLLDPSIISNFSGRRESFGYVSFAYARSSTLHEVLVCCSVTAVVVGRPYPTPASPASALVAGLFIPSWSFARSMRPLFIDVPAARRFHLNPFVSFQ